MAEKGSYVYHIRSYEVGSQGLASPTTLCNLMQDAASRHSHELGVSPSQLLEKGMTWFLARLYLEVGSYPPWKRAVRVETWPAELDRLFAIRDFAFYGEDGERLAVASTSWLLMDALRRRPIVRVPALLKDLHPKEPQRVLSKKPPRVGRVQGGTPSAPLQLRISDLDLNEHVNYTVYIAQLLSAAEVLPRLEGGILRSLQVEFKAESRAGDELVARSKTEDIFESRRMAEEKLVHSLVRRLDGEEIVRARTHWRISKTEGGSPETHGTDQHSEERGSA